MMERAKYNALIRSSINDVTDGRQTVTLPQLQRLLSEYVEVEPPSPTTLSRMLGTMGWTKAPAQSGLIFVRPMGATAPEAVN